MDRRFLGQHDLAALPLADRLGAVGPAVGRVGAQNREREPRGATKNFDRRFGVHLAFGVDREDQAQIRANDRDVFALGNLGAHPVAFDPGARQRLALEIAGELGGHDRLFTVQRQLAARALGRGQPGAKGEQGDDDGGDKTDGGVFQRAPLLACFRPTVIATTSRGVKRGPRPAVRVGRCPG